MSTATNPPRSRPDVAPLLRRSAEFCTFAYRLSYAPSAGRASSGGERPALSGHS